MNKKPVRKSGAGADQPPARRPAGPVSWALCIGLLTFFLYANTLFHDYAVDDGTVMENNEIVKKGVSAWPEIFTTRYRAGFWERKENMYRPLSLAMFAAEWQVAPGNPFPGHLVNVLLFVMTTILVYRLFRKMIPGTRYLVPAVAALLFAAHPIHTEVVANIKSRDEILGLLFAVTTLISLLRYHAGGRLTFLALGALSFMLAMLSKENSITLLAAAPLLLFFFSPPHKRRWWIAAGVLAGTTAAYLAIRVSVLGSLGTETELQIVNNSLLGAETGGDRFATALGVMGRYLWLLVFPHPLVFDYSYNQIPVMSITDPGVLFTLAIIVALLVYAIRTFKRKEVLSFCILFFAISISLVSNFVFLIESTMAERFLYLPSMAFCLAASVLLVRIFKVDRKKKAFHGPVALFRHAPAFSLVLCAVLVLYGAKTIARNANWKNNLTLLAQDVKRSPESARIRYAYGSAILIEQALKEEEPRRKAALLDQAIVQLEKGVSILDTYADAFNHLGIAYKEKGDFARAVSSFEAARRSKNFDNADFYVSLGIAYGSLGRYNEAIKELKRAIEIDPQSFDGYNNLGIYYTDANQITRAIEVLEKAHSLRPENEKPLYNLGNTFAKAGDYQAAISRYKEAVALNGQYEDALNNIGNCYAALKDFRNAIVYYEKVIDLNPRNMRVLNNLGVTYGFLGDRERADKYMQMANALKQNTQPGG